MVEVKPNFVLKKWTCIALWTHDRGDSKKCTICLNDTHE